MEDLKIEEQEEKDEYVPEDPNAPVMPERSAMENW